MAKTLTRVKVVKQNERRWRRMRCPDHQQHATRGGVVALASIQNPGEVACADHRNAAEPGIHPNALQPERKAGTTVRLAK